MNLEAATLKLLLHEKEKEKALATYAELRPEYFSATFRAILSNISDFYDKEGYVPNHNEVQVFRSRDKKSLSALASINLVDVEGVDIHVAVEELANQHAQNTTLDLVDGLLTEISLLSRHDLLDKLAAIPIKLEETLTTSEVVFTARDIPLFSRPEAVAKTKMLSGISNQWDTEAGGYYRQELVLLGGKRGSGKSIMCANLIAQQHLQGNVSIYATIEMTAVETFHRIMCILAEVPFTAIKQGTLTADETKKLAYSMSTLFEGGQAVFDKHFSNSAAVDVYSFQDELQRTCQEKDEGRIIILDDRDLSIATIDVKLSSYKARYGDQLTLMVVDYINQVVYEPGADPYDWKVQTLLGKMLKNLSRKNDVCIVSPYQMDDNGATRFAKGILDAADLAQLINVGIVEDDKGILMLETTKSRSTRDDGKYGISINWDTLRIDPREVDLGALDGEEGSSEDKETAIEGNII